MPRGRPKKVINAETVEPEVTETVEPEVTEQPEDDLSNRVPATFEQSGRILVCAVCGTRASADLDRNLFCSNLHNHPVKEDVDNVK